VSFDGHSIVIQLSFDGHSIVIPIVIQLLFERGAWDLGLGFGLRFLGLGA